LIVWALVIATWVRPIWARMGHGGVTTLLECANISEVDGGRVLSTQQSAFSEIVRAARKHVKIQSEKLAIVLRFILQDGC
jgi:hypothetical protein